jgi:hypothetical protein
VVCAVDVGDPENQTISHGGKRRVLPKGNRTSNLPAAHAKDAARKLGCWRQPMNYRTLRLPLSNFCVVNAAAQSGRGAGRDVELRRRRNYFKRLLAEYTLR